MCDVIFEFVVWYTIFLVCVLWLTLVVVFFFSSISLLWFKIRNETARNVLRSVTSPAKQLALTLFLAGIFSYFFALLGFFFFNEDYEHYECQSLRTCFLTTLNQGIRAGGGIGEYMRQIDPFSSSGINGGGEVGSEDSSGLSTEEPTDAYSYWLFRTAFDLFFFLTLNIVLLNLVVRRQHYQQKCIKIICAWKY